jgi:hypothetical protein
MGSSDGFLHFFGNYSSIGNTQCFPRTAVAVISALPSHPEHFLAASTAGQLIYFALSAFEGLIDGVCPVWSLQAFGNIAFPRQPSSQVQSVLLVDPSTIALGVRNGSVYLVTVPDAFHRHTPHSCLDSRTTSPVFLEGESTGRDVPITVASFADDQIPVSIGFSEDESHLFVLFSEGTFLAFSTVHLGLLFETHLHKRATNLLVSEDALFVVLENQIVSLDPQHHFVVVPGYQLNCASEIVKSVLSASHNRLAISLAPVAETPPQVRLYHVADDFQLVFKLDCGVVELLDFSFPQEYLLVQEYSGTRFFFDLATDEPVPADLEILPFLRWKEDGQLLPENIRRFSDFYNSDDEIVNVAALDPHHFFVADRLGSVS